MERKSIYPIAEDGARVDTRFLGKLPGRLGFRFVFGCTVRFESQTTSKTITRRNKVPTGPESVAALYSPGYRFDTDSSRFSVS